MSKKAIGFTTPSNTPSAEVNDFLGSVQAFTAEHRAARATRKVGEALMAGLKVTPYSAMHTPLVWALRRFPSVALGFEKALVSYISVLPASSSRSQLVRDGVEIYMRTILDTRIPAAEVTDVVMQRAFAYGLKSSMENSK